MKEIIGACLGASSISFVRIKRNEDLITIEDTLTLPHNGDPRKIFKEKLIEFNPLSLPVVVTGRKFRNLVKFTSISEPEAT